MNLPGCLLKFGSRRQMLSGNEMYLKDIVTHLCNNMRPQGEKSHMHGYGRNPQSRKSAEGTGHVYAGAPEQQGLLSGRSSQNTADNIMPVPLGSNPARKLAYIAEVRYDL